MKRPRMDVNLEELDRVLSLAKRAATFKNARPVPGME